MKTLARNVLRTSLDALRRVPWPVLVTVALVVEVGLLFPGLLAGTALMSSQEGWAVSDLLDVAIPMQAHVAQSLRAGAFPAWFGGAYLGMRLSAVPEAVPWYLPSTVLFLLFSPGRAAAFSIASHLVLCGAGGAALSRRLGASREGALFAALALGGGLWLPAHARQYNLLLTAAWFPWVWWALADFISRPATRSATVLGLITGMSLLAGHVQITHHGAVVLCAWTLATLTADRSLRSPTHLFRVAIGGFAAGVGALALGAPHLIPVAEIALQGVRGNTFADGLSRFPAHLDDMLSLLGRGSIAGNPTRLWLDRPMWWEHLTYIGLVPLGLAALGLCLRSPSPARRIALAAALSVALTLALSTASPTATRWLVHLPGMALFRFQGRFLCAATVALAVLAALGFDALRALPPVAARPRLAAWAMPLGLLLTVIDLSGTVVPLCPTASAAMLTAEPRSSRAMRASRPDAQRGLVLQMVSDHDRNLLGLVAGWGRHPEILARAREFLPPQYASLFGWSTVRGYVGITTAATQAAIGDQHAGGVVEIGLRDYLAAPTPHGLDALLRSAGLLGARWVLSSTPLEHPHLRLVHQDAGPIVSVYGYRLDPWVSAAHFVDVDGSPLTDASPVRTTSSSPETIDLVAESRDASAIALPIAWNACWRYSLDGSPPQRFPRPTGLRMALPWPVGHHRAHVTFDHHTDLALALTSLFTLLGGLAVLSRLPSKRRLG